MNLESILGLWFYLESKLLLIAIPKITGPIIVCINNRKINSMNLLD